MDPIRRKILQAGGWSDWMGNTNQGKKVTHIVTRKFSVQLERMDYARAYFGANLVNGQQQDKPAVAGYMVMDDTPSFVRSEISEQWPDKPEKNSIKVTHRVSLKPVGFAIMDQPPTMPKAQEIARSVNLFSQRTTISLK